MGHLVEAGHSQHFSSVAPWDLLACFCHVGEGSLTGSPAARATELSVLPSAVSPSMGQERIQTYGVFLRMVVASTLLSSRKSRKEIKMFSLRAAEQLWDSRDLVSKVHAKEKVCQSLCLLLVPLDAPSNSGGGAPGLHI